MIVWVASYFIALSAPLRDRVSPDTRAGTSSSLRFFSVLVPCAGEAPALLPADGTQGVAGPHSIPLLCASEVGI